MENPTTTLRIGDNAADIPSDRPAITPPPPAAFGPQSMPDLTADPEGALLTINDARRSIHAAAREQQPERVTALLERAKMIGLGTRQDITIAIAETLLANGFLIHAENLLTKPGGDISHVQWPNSVESCLILCRVALRCGYNKTFIIRLLTRPDGLPKFPRDNLLNRILFGAMEDTGQTRKLIRTYDFLKPADPHMVLVLLRILQRERRYKQIMERFFDGTQLRLPCEGTPEICSIIAYALNALDMHETTCGLFYQIASEEPFRSFPAFIEPLTYALNKVRRCDYAVTLLLDDNTRPRFPNSRTCMRNLAFALRELNRFDELDKLPSEALEGNHRIRLYPGQDRRRPKRH